MKFQSARLFFSLKSMSAIVLAGSFLLGFNSPVFSNEGPASTNPLIRKQEEETLAKLKKLKPEEQADALYDLGKSCFDARDYDRAEQYIGYSLQKEEGLNRGEQCCKSHLALAIVLAVGKRFSEAESEYKKALDLAVKADLKDYVGLITDSLGTLALKNGKLDEASDYFKKAFEIGKKADDIPVQMNALVNQATTLRRAKKTEEALELLHQALVISEKGEKDRSLGLALVNLARVQHDLGNLDESVAASKKAIEVFNQDLDYESEANAYWSLGETYFDLRRIPEAAKSYQQGFEALKDEPDNALKISLLIGLGSAEADLGHFDKAQKIHEQAYEMSRALKNRATELEAVLQMGNDLLLSGFPEAALYRLLEGERILDAGDLGASKKGSFLIAIGRCYKSLGQVDSAQKYYEEALKLFEDISDKQSRALALNSLAVLALDHQNKADFDLYYNEARQIYDKLDDKRDLAILDYNYAQYLFTEGKYAEAAEKHSNALSNIKGIGDKVTEGKILRGIGIAEYYANHPQQAMSYYEKAMALANESGEVEAQWDSHLGLGKCFKKLGLNDMAVSHLSKAVDLVEKERGRFTRDSFKTFNLDLRNDCYIELVDLLVRMNKAYDALEVAEKGRARAFLDMLSSRKKGRSVESFEAPMSSRAQPQAEGRQLVAMANPGEKGSRGVSVIPRASQIYASTAISPVNATAPDIEEIKSLVRGSKSTLVEYYLLPDKIVVWVIDPDTTIHMLPPIPLSKKQLDEKVALTYQAITQQPKNAEEVKLLASRRQDLLREMHTLLLKPIETYLPKDENSVVTIVPHGPMFMIPFAALIDDDKKFLVEKHTLSYVPAIGVLRATQKLEQAVSQEPDRLLAFGNPITKSIAFLGALPYSEKEVQNIANLFGQGNAVVKIGQEADKKTFESLAPQFSEVHLATHGLVDEENPMQSSLVLAPTKGDDGLLSVKDILAMKELKAKLVVLSACQTGRGKITGDGVVGLSRAFIIAGTPAVLVSQWNVDDIITEFQMKSFYKGYLAGIGKSKSLRQAQLDTIKFMEGTDSGKSVRANPRYWAAFQLIGQSS